MFLALNLMFVATGYMHANISGQSMLIFVLSITAAEVAIILGLVITHLNKRKNIFVSSMENLKEISDN